MKIAICISGETRTWDRLCNFYEMYYSITTAYPDVQFDIYGVTWDHCELPVNTHRFKNVNIVNWHDKDFRLLEQYKEVYYKAKSEIGNLPEETRDIAFLNNLAQWWIMLQCFKDAATTDDYDLYVRTRWDLNYNVEDITERIQTKEKWFTNLSTLKTLFGSAVSVEYGAKNRVKFHDQFFILSKDIIDTLDFSNNTAAMSLVNTFGLNNWPPIHLYKFLSATIFNYYDPNLNFEALTVFNKEWFRRINSNDAATIKYFQLDDIDKAQQIKRPK